MQSNSTRLFEELRVLKNDLHAKAAERGGRKPARSTSRNSHAVFAPPRELDDRLRADIQELAKLSTHFLRSAEKPLKDHPITGIAGALIVGVGLGYLLCRH